MSESEQVIALLMLAKDKLIDEWSSTPMQPDGYCAVMAFEYAFEQITGEWLGEPAAAIHRAGTDYLTEAAGVDYGAMVDWSDTGPKQKVIDGFDEAIRLAKEGME